MGAEAYAAGITGIAETMMYLGESGAEGNFPRLREERSLAET
jgi:hypothetical protein